MPLQKPSCYSTFRETVNEPAAGAPAPAPGSGGALEPGERLPIGIQEATAASRGSALRRYQDLVVGSRSLWRLILHEAVVTLTSWVPGALGLALRGVAYRLVLGSVGRGVTFGHGVVLRHPGKVHLGDGVIVDDLVVLDAKGSSNTGIRLGRGVFLGRGTILSCKDGDIELGDHVNLGFHCEVFSASRVRVGPHGLFAAQTYLVGGGHDFDDPDKPILEQQRTSRGIDLGENVWLGTGTKVLDGVRIGRDVVVGAGSVVREDLPDGVIAAGVPARVIRGRRGPEPGEPG